MPWRMGSEAGASMTAVPFPLHAPPLPPEPAAHCRGRRAGATPAPGLPQAHRAGLRHGPRAGDLLLPPLYRHRSTGVPRHGEAFRVTRPTWEAAQPSFDRLEKARGMGRFAVSPGTTTRTTCLRAIRPPASVGRVMWPSWPWISCHWWWRCEPATGAPHPAAGP